MAARYQRPYLLVFFLTVPFVRADTTASSTSCSSQPWSSNTENQTPCTVVNLVVQACLPSFSFTFNQSIQENSYAPNSTTANACSCSWAAYNLMSAYIFPGPRVFVFLAMWPLFPYGPQPINWTDGTFDATLASNTAQDNQPNVNGSPTPTPGTSSQPPPSSKPVVPVGAIVGGVIGGVCLVVLALTFIWFVRRRGRQQRTAMSNGNGFKSNGNGSAMMSPTKQKSSAAVVPPAPPGFPQTSATMSTSPYSIRTAQAPSGNSAVSLHSLSLASAAAARSPDSKQSLPDRDDITSLASPQRRMNPPPYSPVEPEPKKRPETKKHVRNPSSSNSHHSRTGSSSTRGSAHSHRKSGYQFWRKDGGSISTMQSIDSVASTSKKPRATRMGSAGSIDSTQSRSGSDGARTVMTVIERNERGPAV
ncbi:hypothetical protein BJ138DRAFT_1102416 [Hygrophoropsis aurantiaca]|uniref:Uncharacterized protein n=1 Tax=Hygrophoropsis aurantiaca TaxID=72124 RepID=A0ACB8A9K8_9AGAM|nr:hypothetical protein BJ138DRAFT_1102416 [Hygrophoropsis aurantiaca]